MTGLEWRTIPGYPKYEVSSDGQVRGGRTEGHLLKPYVSGRPARQRVRLYLDGARKEFGIHILVALAFLGSRPEGAQVVRHLDDNPLNNRPENLAYGTHQDNAFDAVRNRVHPNSRKTHCKRGHEFTPENTLVTVNDRGVGRTCKTCKRAITRACYYRHEEIYKARRKARK